MAQLVAANLARRGFVVLGYDPIGQGEREMLPDLNGPGGSILNGTEHHSPTFEHEYVQRQASLMGVNAASLWLSDLTVMLDVLQALPEVNPDKLGVAGCSGGGTQTAYISAMDPRVAASSIACYESTLMVDYAPSPGGGGGPAEGEQQWGPYVGGGSILLDKPDLLVARAPRPTQVLLTTEDQYFRLIGGEAAVAEANPAFEALGEFLGSNLTSTVGVNDHGYINKTRLALYAFMMRELQGKQDSGVELQTEFFTFEQMRVTSTGSVLTAREINQGNGSITTHKAFIGPMAEKTLSRLRENRQKDPQNFLESVRTTVAAAIGYRSPVEISRDDVTGALGNGSAPVFLLPGEGQCKVALQVLNRTAIKPHMEEEEEEAVLYVSRKGGTLEDPEPGKLSSIETERVEAIRARGYTVILVDPCGFGTLGDKAGDAFGLFTLPDRGLYRVHLSTPVDVAFNVNRSLVGYHAADIVRAAAAVATAGILKGQPPRRVVATISANETAAAVLSAAVITQQEKESRVQSMMEGGGKPRSLLGAVAVLSSVASWADIIGRERYALPAYYSFVFGVLKTFDIPDLCGALHGPVFIAAPLDAEQRLLSQESAQREYAFATASNPEVSLGGGIGSSDHSKAGDGNGDPMGITRQLLAWLQSL